MHPPSRAPRWSLSIDPSVPRRQLTLDSTSPRCDASFCIHRGDRPRPVAARRARTPDVNCATATPLASMTTGAAATSRCVRKYTAAATRNSIMQTKNTRRRSRSRPRRAPRTRRARRATSARRPSIGKPRRVSCACVRAAHHAPRGPFDLLERRHGLAVIVERGAGVFVECLRVNPSHSERERMILAENA